MKVGLFLDFDMVLSKSPINVQFAELLGVDKEFVKIEDELSRGQIGNKQFNEKMIPLFNQSGFSKEFAREHYRDIELNDCAEELVQCCPEDTYIVSSGPNYFINIFANEYGIPRGNILCSKYEFDLNGGLSECISSVASRQKSSFVKRKSEKYDVTIGVGDSPRLDGGFLGSCTIRILTSGRKERYLEAQSLSSVLALVESLFSQSRNTYHYGNKVDREGVDQILDGSPFDKNVFVMMPFRDDVRFKEIERSIKEALEKLGFKCQIASNDYLDVDAIWSKVKCYMHACKYGIAVVTTPTQDADCLYNPNVMTEAGYMLGQGKRVFLLKDSKIKMPVDWLGREYKSFKLDNPNSGVTEAVNQWFKKLS